jgi:hypothetical protein
MCVFRILVLVGFPFGHATSPIRTVRAIIWYKSTYESFYLGLGSITDEAAVVWGTMCMSFQVTFCFFVNYLLQLESINTPNRALDHFPVKGQSRVIFMGHWGSEPCPSVTCLYFGLTIQMTLTMFSSFFLCSFCSKLHFCVVSVPN